MPEYHRNRTINPKLRSKLKARLYRQLHKKAFDAFFECQECGSHQDLEIHHLFYDPDLFCDPISYIILCFTHHRRVHRKPTSGPRVRSKRR